MDGSDMGGDNDHQFYSVLFWLLAVNIMSNMKKLLLFILLIVGRGINNIKCSLILRDVSYDENSEVTYSESTHVYEKWGKFNSWVDNVDGAERECAVG